MSGIPERVRPHHWGFANAWLKSSFQRIPETIVSALARARSAEPVHESWNNFAKTLEKDDRMPAEGLEASTYAVSAEEGEWFVALVRLPPPEQPREAYFAGLAVHPADGELRPDLEDEAPRGETTLRYFLLERTDRGEPLLVEWRDDERRQVELPAEGAPAPDEEALVRAIRHLLRRETDRTS